MKSYFIFFLNTYINKRQSWIAYPKIFQNLAWDHNYNNSTLSDTSFFNEFLM